MALSKGDFVRVDFTGRTADGLVFDTTKADVAKTNGLRSQNVNYEPITVCLGYGYLLPALEERIIGKEMNSRLTTTLSPDEAFGRKRADLLKLMPLKVFEKQKVKPYPGLEVTIDDQRGLIKTITGNRVIVDFNHMLAGQDIVYDIEIHDSISDAATQVEAVVGRTLGFAPKVSVDGSDATITLPIELPAEFSSRVKEAVTEQTSILSVKFATPSKEKPKTSA